MKNRLLLLILLIVMLFYSINRSSKRTSFFYNEPNTVKVKSIKDDSIQKYEVEDYLIGVLAGEMPASFNEEALKAQAVASRTFAYYKIKTSNGDYDLTNDTTSQVHLTSEEMKLKWGKDYFYYLQRIKRAINDTKNQVLTYNGDIIEAYYFSLSNGYTENSEYVFNEERDYLKSVPSKDDENNQNFISIVNMEKDDFSYKLGIYSNNITINDIKRTNTGRVDTITINDKEYKGTEIRKLLNLRSTDFDFEVSDNIKITTKGYGHGVGMSQYGANYMAEDGYNYKEILSYYYQNTSINNICSFI